MRVVIAILAVVSAGILSLNAEIQENRHTIFWKNRFGQVVYEGQYEVRFWGGMPMLNLVESYRHGPFVYKCMAPERIDHGNGIYIRNYLPQPTLCYVPRGYKVCLKPAYVQHGPIKVLPTSTWAPETIRHA